MAAIDTRSNTVIATIHTGQSPQGMVYIPDAVPSGSSTDNLLPIGWSGEAVHVTLAFKGASTPETTVAVNNQGLVALLGAGVTGLSPNQPYVLALATSPDGSGPLEPVVSFRMNPAGAQVVVGRGATAPGGGGD